MKILHYFRSSVVWGLLLIGGGVALLLQNLFDLPLGGLFWAAVFGVVGLAFLSMPLENRSQWWAFIPGMGCLGLMLSSLAESFLPASTAFVTGGLFLGMLGMGFILVYLSGQERWWALIPGGVLLTLAAVSVVDEGNFALDSGGVLFLGLGLTFFAVALLPGGSERRWWAYIPGGILAVMGVVILSASGQLFSYIGGVGLLIAGGLLLLRALRPSGQ